MTRRDALEVPEIPEGTRSERATFPLSPRRERLGYLRWQRAPALGAALLLYVLAVCGTTAYSYLTARAALIAEIDKDLLMAARAVRYILPDLTGLGNRRAFSDAMEGSSRSRSWISTASSRSTTVTGTRWVTGSWWPLRTPPRRSCGARRS